jgi:hypothetical protein
MACSLVYSGMNRLEDTCTLDLSQVKRGLHYFTLEQVFQCHAFRDILKCISALPK